MGLNAPRHVGSSQARDRTGVHCLDRQILLTLSHQENLSFIFICLFDLHRVLVAACKPLVVVKEEAEQALS